MSFYAADPPDGKTTEDLRRIFHIPPGIKIHTSGSWWYWGKNENSMVIRVEDKYYVIWPDTAYRRKKWRLDDGYDMVGEADTLEELFGIYIGHRLAEGD